MNRWAVILLLTAAALPVFPQTEEDVPGKGVARLSVMNGEVSVRRGDSGDLIAAALNAPLVITDRVITGSQSRAEVQFDWSNMLRIGANSEVRLSELENGRYQIQIALGTTTFRVLRNSNAYVELSTPNVSVRPLGVGLYRITVREDGSSEVTVRAGEAEVFTPRGSERLRAGSTLLARGTVSDAEYQEAAAIPMDAWDGWNENRDRDLERSHSYQYVSQDISGAEDLDQNGRWVSAEGYGNVWAPAVAPGWAPYRNGRWAWVDYYGWTWVSYDPWGWAPYHYGRWFNSPAYGWCWWPGGIHERYYWRPALVAFFGWGGGYHGGAGFGFGNVGWVPLAPHEPFYPWYGRGRSRNPVVANNIIHNTNIASVYRNARVPNGISAVGGEVFGRRNFTSADLVRVNGAQLQNAGLVRGVLPVTPGRESLRLADRVPAAASIARVTDNRQFYSRQPAHVAERVPFEQQRQAVDQVTRRSFGAPVSASTAAGPAARAPASGWRQVGTPSAAPQSSSQSVRSAPAQEQAPWHRFGDPAPHATAPAMNSTRGSYAPQMPRSIPPPASNNDSYGQRFSPGNGYPSYAPRQDSGFGSAYTRPNGSEAVRISPPMVRERPSVPPSGGGGSHNSAPAQRSSGGGGSSHSSSGGGAGGGGHSRGR